MCFKYIIPTIRLASNYVFQDYLLCNLFEVYKQFSDRKIYSFMPEFNLTACCYAKFIDPVKVMSLSYLIQI